MTKQQIQIYHPYWLKREVVYSRKRPLSEVMITLPQHKVCK